MAKPERVTSREDSPQFSAPQVSCPQPAVCSTLVVTEPIEVADCKPVKVKSIFNIMSTVVEPTEDADCTPVKETVIV